MLNSMSPLHASGLFVNPLKTAESSPRFSKGEVDYLYLGNKRRDEIYFF